MSNLDLRARLAEAAKKLGLRMPQAQLLLAQERFLFRIAQVDLKNNLIWKGGSLILRRYSTLEPPRFTVDIDLMVKDIDFAAGEILIKDALSVDLTDEFEFMSFKKFPMERDTPYGGERFEILWTFQGKQNSEPLRIDLCAGDDVDPENIKMNEVYLLDDDASAVTFAVYPPEFIFAEKLETLTRFATGNTRLKDFIDLWSLSQSQDEHFYRNLKDAIRRCFKRRKTRFDPNVWQAILLDQDFQKLMEVARNRNFQKLNIPAVPILFKEIAAYLKALDPWS